MTVYTPTNGLSAHWTRTTGRPNVPANRVKKPSTAHIEDKYRIERKIDV